MIQKCKTGVSTEVGLALALKSFTNQDENGSKASFGRLSEPREEQIKTHRETKQPVFARDLMGSRLRRGVTVGCKGRQGTLGNISYIDFGVK